MWRSLARRRAGNRQLRAENAALLARVAKLAGDSDLLYLQRDQAVDARNARCAELESQAEELGKLLAASSERLTQTEQQHRVELAELQEAWDRLEGSLRARIAAMEAACPHAARVAELERTLRAQEDRLARYEGREVTS